MKKSFTFGYAIIAVLLAFVWMSLHASTSAAVPAMILTDTPTATPTDTPATPPTDTPTATPTDTPPPPPTNTPGPTSTPQDTPPPGPTDTPAPDLTPEGVLTLPITGQGALVPLLVLLVVGVGLLGLARLRHSHLR